MWLDLLAEADEDSKQIIEARINKNNALSDVALGAYLMDHRYKGRKLNEQQNGRARSFVYDQLSTTGLESMAKYLTGADIFQYVQSNDLGPESYWKLVEAVHQELGCLGRKLACIPGSSAQLERVFSNWGMVHTDVRNRLGAEKSEKLIYIYYSNRINMDMQLLSP